MDQLDSFDRDIKSMTGFIDNIETELSRLSQDCNTDPADYAELVRNKMDYTALLEDVKKKREAFIASQQQGAAGKASSETRKEYDRRNKTYLSTRSNYLKPGDN